LCKSNMLVQASQAHCVEKPLLIHGINTLSTI